MASNINVDESASPDTSSDSSDQVERYSNGSGTDDTQEFVPAGKVLGYQFEPLRTTPREDPAEDLLKFRLDNTDWCQCGHCVSMPTGTECVCCCEVEKVWEVVDACVSKTGKEMSCITLHPGFYEVCLGEYALQTAGTHYRRPNRDTPINDQYRYTAYRQFVRFCFGRLGRHNRQVIPACAVNKIRTTFPSPTGDFVGYKVSDFFD